MIFLSRELLWLMFGVPMLAGTYLALLRRRKAVLILSDLSPVRAAIARSSQMRRHLPPLLLLFAIVALLFAIARPAAIVPMLSAQRTVVMVIDVSLSMGATDVE